MLEEILLDLYHHIASYISVANPTKSIYSKKGIRDQH